MDAINSSLSDFCSPRDDEVVLTEILYPKDDRCSLPQMHEEKKKEIANLLARGTFKVILRKEVPPNGNVLPGLFVLAIRSTEDGEIKFKAR